MSTTATTATTTSATKKENRYSLGGKQAPLFNALKRVKGATTGLTKSQIVEVGEKQGNDAGYVDYMIKGLKAKNFLKMKQGKFIISDGSKG